MYNLKKIYTKKGDISLFTVMVLSMVMMALLFNISIKTNRDLTTSRDSNLSQQAYNKAIKGAEAWIECASDPSKGTIDPDGVVDLTSCNISLNIGACSQDTNNGIQSSCEVISSVGQNFITSKATSSNTAGKTVNRVIRVEFTDL